LTWPTGGVSRVKFEVVGLAIKNNQRRKIVYGEFDEYADAYDYKKWLENPTNWKTEPGKQPYIVLISEKEADDNIDDDTLRYGDCND